MIFGIWTAVGTLAFLRQYLQGVERGAPAQFWPDLPLWMLCFYPAAILSPFVFRLERRVSQSTPSRGRRVTILIFASVLASCVELWLGTLLDFLGGVLLGRHSPFPFRLFGSVSFVSIGVQEAFFWSTLGAGYVIRQLIESQEQRQKSTRLALEKSELESCLRKAELETLRMRLNPHFLFNALQNIALLTQHSPRTASQMLVRLGDLLRCAVEPSAKPEVTLQEEVLLTEKYWAIEKVRFGDRLSVILEIAPCTEAAVVPAMLLQPLVENGIRHGLAGSHTTHGVITIRSAQMDGKLILSVTDNGRGLPRPFQDLPAGVGLGTTKERLTLLYGSEHEFTAMTPEGSGTEVKIVLPFRTQNDARGSLHEKRTPVADC